MTAPSPDFLSMWKLTLLATCCDVFAKAVFFRLSFGAHHARPALGSRLYCLLNAGHFCLLSCRFTARNRVNALITVASWPVVPIVRILIDEITRCYRRKLSFLQRSSQFRIPWINQIYRLQFCLVSYSATMSIFLPHSSRSSDDVYLPWITPRIN